MLDKVFEFELHNILDQIKFIKCDAILLYHYTTNCNP
jgi:hypothetical protein